MAPSDNDTESDSGSDTTAVSASAAMQKRAALAGLSFKDQLWELIEPFRSSKRRPPFTTGELIVIALAISHKESLADSTIYCWILATFHFYRDKAIVEYAMSRAGIRLGESAESDEVVGDFDFAIRDFDLPIESDDDLDYCSITESAARRYLARWLEPEPKGTLRFLDLPPELRNRIYEMLFRFPRQGLRTETQHSNSSRLIPLSMSPTDEIPGRRDPYEKVYCPPLPSILSILATNNQVYKEAMPMFYGLNTFVFDRPFQLDRTLQKLPHERTKHLKNINLQLRTGDQDVISSDARNFWRLSLEGILSLDVLIYSMSSYFEREWMKNFSRRRGGKQWGECNGFKGYFREAIKAAKKAKRFEIHGNCPDFKAFMASKVKVCDPVDVEEI